MISIGSGCEELLVLPCLVWMLTVMPLPGLCRRRRPLLPSLRRLHRPRCRRIRTRSAALCAWPRIMSCPPKLLSSDNACALLSNDRGCLFWPCRRPSMPMNPTVSMMVSCGCQGHARTAPRVWRCGSTSGTANCPGPRPTLLSPLLQID